MRPPGGRRSRPRLRDTVGQVSLQPISITVPGQRRWASEALGSPDPSGNPPGCQGGAGSLYVHVPFCFHKCHYCDFYSFVDQQDQQAAYLGALETELRALAPFAVLPPPKGPGLRTIFIGGGTPTLLGVDLWDRLLDTLDCLFRTRELARAGRLEFSVECNPETATPELMRVLRAGGVTRLSIGAQSFHPGHLATLERRHEPANVERAVGLAADAGIVHRSIDLIFAIPGQTLDDWRIDLRRAVAIADGAGLDHMSCYDLTYEPNTAMTRRLERGEFRPADEDTEVAMFRLTRSVLLDAGFRAYEVSNFARDEPARCRHNLAYWRQESWLAAGPSASGHYRGFRWKNTPNLGEWMKGVHESRGFSPLAEVESPDPRRALAEVIMTGLRLDEGLDTGALLDRGEALGAGGRLRAELEEQARFGAVDLSGGRARLTETGVLIADGVARKLMRALG